VPALTVALTLAHRQGLATERASLTQQELAAHQGAYATAGGSACKGQPVAGELG